MICQRIGLSPISTMGFGFSTFFADAGAETTCKYYYFHVFSPCLFRLKGIKALFYLLYQKGAYLQVGREIHPDARRSRMTGQSRWQRGQSRFELATNSTNIHECQLTLAKVYVGVGSQNRL